MKKDKKEMSVGELEKKIAKFDKKIESIHYKLFERDNGHCDYGIYSKGESHKFLECITFLSSFVGIGAAFGAVAYFGGPHVYGQEPSFCELAASLGGIVAGAIIPPIAVYNSLKSFIEKRYQQKEDKLYKKMKALEEESHSLFLKLENARSRGEN